MADGGQYTCSLTVFPYGIIRGNTLVVQDSRQVKREPSSRAQLDRQAGKRWPFMAILFSVRLGVYRSLTPSDAPLTFHGLTSFRFPLVSESSWPLLSTFSVT
ncbi:unnamed protein product [Gadus morhua 'NCC']